MTFSPHGHEAGTSTPHLPQIISDLHFFARRVVAGASQATNLRGRR